MNFKYVKQIYKISYISYHTIKVFEFVSANFAVACMYQKGYEKLF